MLFSGVIESRCRECGSTETEWVPYSAGQVNVASKVGLRQCVPPSVRYYRPH